jgi:nucleotide-binding universal stress UspA family protein
MMAIRDILVHLDATAPSQARLDLAAALARRLGAQLTGLAVIEIALPPIASPDGGGAALGPLLDAMRRDALAEAEGLRTAFEATLRRTDTGGSWVQVEGITAEPVARHGRHADLIVLGQEQPGGATPTAAAVIEAALFSSGRPVLVVPHAGRFADVGRRAVIGWNARREATRALHDALPLLADGGFATVLTVDAEPGTDGHRGQPGADIARHLERHGLRTAVENATSGGLDAADLMLNHAAESAADLLVIGAYGHSRLRELVLGGVTRSILRQMTLPVLMSH